MTDVTKRDADEREMNPTETRDDGSGEIAASPEAQLAQKEEEIAGLVDRLKRLQAEFENYKKRMAREAADTEERIVDREIRDFLPLYDNLHRAFSSYRGNNDAGSFIEGIERIFAQFNQVLKQKGIARIDAAGQPFDPAQHEALLSVASEDPSNVVLEEFEPGYLRGSRLLRPSKVKVSRGMTEEEQT